MLFFLLNCPSLPPFLYSFLLRLLLLLLTQSSVQLRLYHLLTQTPDNMIGVHLHAWLYDVLASGLSNPFFFPTVLQSFYERYDFLSGKVADQQCLLSRCFKLSSYSMSATALLSSVSRLKISKIFHQDQRDGSPGKRMSRQVKCNSIYESIYLIHHDD